MRSIVRVFDGPSFGPLDPTCAVLDPSGDDAFLPRIALCVSVTSVAYRIEMPLRECEECRRAFEPSSRHLRCPACRARDLCTCGRPKQAKSVTCGTCRNEAGDTNGNWKGGRTRHKAGYVMVRAPGHPRAGRSPYVFEHILVAEEILGRHLVDGESVHHRNGVRDDNDPRTSSLDASSTVRYQGERRHRVGAPDLRTYGGPGAPPTMLTLRLSILGGGGNRTRVLRHLSGPSPSAAGRGLSGAALLPAAAPPRIRLSVPRRPVGTPLVSPT